MSAQKRDPVEVTGARVEDLGKDSSSKATTDVVVAGGLIPSQLTSAASEAPGLERRTQHATTLKTVLNKVQLRGGKIDVSIRSAQLVGEALDGLSLSIWWFHEELLAAGSDPADVNQFMCIVLRFWQGDRHITDLGSAHRLVAFHGHDLRHSAAVGWLAWDGKHWRSDAHVEAMTAAKLIPRSWAADAAVIFQAAMCANDKEEMETLHSRASFVVKHAKASESAAKLKAMLELASTEPGIAIEVGHLDADPWLLNVSNGTIDLRTGGLRPHDRSDLITRVAPTNYVPGARHPLWEKFLSDTTGGDNELARYLQRAAGSGLVGINIDEVMFFLFGPGGSGKSTFVGTVKATLGDYVMTADFETFLKKSGSSGIRNDIARLKGARIVTSIEVDDGKELAQGLVKTITGGDAVSARLLYKEFVEFVPGFSLWMVANHAPGFDADDDAMTRRIKVIPFAHGRSEGDRDPAVKATLQNPELVGEAILAWLVDGCLAWQAEGLGTATAVKNATADYHAEMDDIGHFIKECCTIGADCVVETGALYPAYKEWAQDNGVFPILTGTLFGRRLTKKGFQQTKVRGKRGWRGLRLNTLGTTSFSAYVPRSLPAGSELD